MKGEFMTLFLKHNIPLGKSLRTQFPIIAVGSMVKNLANQIVALSSLSAITMFSVYTSKVQLVVDYKNRLNPKFWRIFEDIF